MLEENGTVNYNEGFIKKQITYYFTKHPSCFAENSNFLK